MILRRIFAEVLHGIDDLGAILYLVKNNERLFGHDLLAACQHQVLQDAVNILGSLKELLIFFVFIKVEIGGIFIVTLAKLFQNPGLAHLTHALQNQGLAIGGVLPVQQLLQNKSFHSSTPHTFIGVLVSCNHTFIICTQRRKYNPYHKIIRISSYYNHTFIHQCEPEYLCESDFLSTSYFALKRYLSE